MFPPRESSAQRSPGAESGASPGAYLALQDPQARACCPLGEWVTVAGPWTPAGGPRASPTAPGALSTVVSTAQGSPRSWLHARPSVLRVNRCGTLFCEGGQPPERSSCTLTTSSGACQALVQDSSSAYEPVPEGTKCGKEQVGRTRLGWAAGPQGELLGPRAGWWRLEEGSVLGRNSEGAWGVREKTLLS